MDAHGGAKASDFFRNISEHRFATSSATTSIFSDLDFRILGTLAVFTSAPL